MNSNQSLSILILTKKTLIDPNALKKHVIQLSVNLPARNHTSENLKATAEYIENEFLKTNAKVEIQEFDVWGIKYRNVIASYDTNSKEVIVIGAHYDTYQGLTGANNNASGIAALLKLARLLQHDTLKTPIILAAYALEEPPYFRTNDMGSYHHAKQLKDNHIPVKFMISIETIGFYSSTPNSQQYPHP